MKGLEERVKEVAEILAEWNSVTDGSYDEGTGLYKISKILNPEFRQAWIELLKFQNKKGQ